MLFNDSVAVLDIVDFEDYHGFTVFVLQGGVEILDVDPCLMEELHNPTESTWPVVEFNGENRG